MVIWAKTPNLNHSEVAEVDGVDSSGAGAAGFGSTLSTGNRLPISIPRWITSELGIGNCNSELNS